MGGAGAFLLAALGARCYIIPQRQIAKLEPMLDGYRAHLAEVEVKIIKLDGLLFLPPHRRANPYFKPGELPRIALKLMKEAERAGIGALACRPRAGAQGVPLPTAWGDEADPAEPVVNADAVGQARAGGEVRDLERVAA